VAAHRLRRRKHVANAIAAALTERVGVTRSRIIEEVSRPAFSNVSQVLEVRDGVLIVKDHADLDPDTMSTIAEVREAVNDKGFRTLHVRQYDRLQALTLLARVSGMPINKTEPSGPAGSPSRSSTSTITLESAAGSTSLPSGCRQRASGR
jgi:hypothetical protein